jgi:hypothetical protein
LARARYLPTSLKLEAPIFQMSPRRSNSRSQSPCTCERLLSGPRPAGYAAHHIVAGADKRAEIARGILKKFGIGINDAKNGVFLPANQAAQVIAGETIHSTLHTKEHYDAVNDALMVARTRPQTIAILRRIGQALQSGNFP